MITGSCHCGTLRWEFDPEPDGATVCNCTVCRRYGVLWAYDYETRASVPPASRAPTCAAR